MNRSKIIFADLYKWRKTLLFYNNAQNFIKDMLTYICYNLGRIQIGEWGCKTKPDFWTM